MLKSVLVSGWAAVAVSAVGGTWFTGTTVAAAIEPTWLIVTASALTLVASTVAALGVIIGGKFWRLEWVGAGLAGAGLAYYASVPLSYLIGGEIGRLQQAGLVVSALIGFVVYRMAACWVHSRELARIHEEEKLVQRVG